MLLFIVLVVFLILSVGLAWFLVALDKGQKEPVGWLWIAFGFGFLGAIAAGLIESLLISEKDMLPSAGMQAIFVATLMVGIIEEACKFLPLALSIYKKPFFNEHTDGLIYFGLAGLGFGLPENIVYTLLFGAHVGVERAILTPFFHAAITGMVGFYLIRLKLNHKSPLGVIPVLLAAMLIHGLYDFGLSVGNTALSVASLFITVILSASLFVLYFKARQLDQDVGLSVVGNNAFCRSCGAPNPDHSLYCTRCGKNA